MNQEKSTKKEKMTILQSESNFPEDREREEEEDTRAASTGFMLSKLPWEITYEFLLKLPIETLSVCRAVNKAWYRTMKNPGFIKTYNTRVIHNSNFPFISSQGDQPQEFHDRDDDAEDTSLTFYTQTPPISEIHPCNGFLLCISRRKDPYFISNPFTGEHMVVHVPNTPGRAYRPAIAGLGWDPVFQVFKIIRISDDCTHKLYYGTHLQVYNFSTGEWTRTSWTVRGRQQAPVRVSSMNRFAYKPNTFLHGSLHWMAYPYSGSVTILSFKLATEVFQQLPMPPGLDLDPIEARPHFRFRGVGIPQDTRRFPHHLAVLGEFLCIVHNVDNEHVEIWVMEKYGSASSWRKKHTIRNIREMNNEDVINGPYKPIQLMQTGEILLLCSEQNLGYYHPVTKHFRAFDSGDVHYRSSVSQPPLHIGSLIYLAEKP